MQHKMPTIYYLPFAAGVASIAIHVVELGIINTHPELLTGMLFFAVQMVGFCLAALSFGGFAWVFSEERLGQPVAIAGTGHGLLIAAVSFHYLKLEEWRWVSPTAMLLILATLIPYLLAQFSKVKQHYTPGGRNASEWEVWRQQIADEINDWEARIGTFLDTATLQVEALRTESGHKTDVVRMLAEMQALKEALPGMIEAEAKRQRLLEKDAERKAVARKAAKATEQ